MKRMATARFQLFGQETAVQLKNISMDYGWFQLLPASAAKKLKISGPSYRFSVPLLRSIKLFSAKRPAKLKFAAEGGREFKLLSDGPAEKLKCRGGRCGAG